MRSAARDDDEEEGEEGGLVEFLRKAVFVRSVCWRIVRRDGRNLARARRASIVLYFDASATAAAVFRGQVAPIIYTEKEYLKAIDQVFCVSETVIFQNRGVG